MQNQQQKINQQPTSDLTLKQARNTLRQFVKQREWSKFHTPRNLLLALVGEVGELSQIFQWKGEVPINLQTFTEKQKIHVGEQVVDVFNYLVRFADVCGIDMEKAFVDKMEKNRGKYPKDMVKGSSKKYSEYKQKFNQTQEEE